MTVTAALSLTDGHFLARLAADAVHARLTGNRLSARIPHDSPLHDDGATFVTLERNGALRGCVGSLEPVRPLHRDVVQNAMRAMNDPRLPPVTPLDWPSLDVKVSVLDRPEPIASDSRDVLLAALRPGVDGLILLTDDGRRATFLPSVWAKVTDPELFLAALLRKGGWPEVGWPAGLRASRYGSTEFHNRAPRAALPLVATAVTSSPATIDGAAPDPGAASGGPGGAAPGPGVAAGGPGGAASGPGGVAGGLGAAGGPGGATGGPGGVAGGPGGAAGGIGGVAGGPGLGAGGREA
ncbi:MAG TPA: AmmeMemoRadiSam system protein A [Dactylosporangium sp.]|nr:AmmeMemoRadiSam system protein A [Dactylosporangium sp.]